MAKLKSKTTISDEEFQDKPKVNKHRSPKPHNKIFTRYWNDYLPDITKRENFKPGHLRQLEILCDLHCECDELSVLVSKIGYSFVSKGRNGTQHRVRPEVQQLNRVRTEIKNYSKILGLLLAKDKTFKLDGETDNDSDENWE